MKGRELYSYALQATSQPGDRLALFNRKKTAHDTLKGKDMRLL